MNLYELFLHDGVGYGAVWHLQSRLQRDRARCGRSIAVDSGVFIDDAAGPVCRACRTDAHRVLAIHADLLAELDQPGGLP